MHGTCGRDACQPMLGAERTGVGPRFNKGFREPLMHEDNRRRSRGDGENLLFPNQRSWRPCPDAKRPDGS